MSMRDRNHERKLNDDGILRKDGMTERGNTIKLYAPAILWRRHKNGNL